jgi:hypothetical protein
VEVPAKLDYKPVREKLMEMEAEEKIYYAEPNLAEKHKY